MPRSSCRNPSYRHHKPSGQAVVTLNGRDHYLGAYGTRASKNEYDRLIAEWLAGGRQLPTAQYGPDCSVAELVNAFRVHVAKYYRHPDGTPTHEVKCFQIALRLLRQAYGHTSAAQFGPLALKALRQTMIERGWSRGYTNQQIRRIKAAFRWAVEQQLVPPSVYHGLEAVAGLKYGRSDAREMEPVRPVSEAVVEQTLLHATPTIAAMARLQLITGMRPGEVCSLRGCDLQRSGKVWIYRPIRHKMQYKGLTRQILIGPQAQRYLEPYLKPDLSAYLFSPRQAEAERLAALHARRVTPENQGNRPGLHKKRRPRKCPGERYDAQSYNKAIRSACCKAWPVPDPLRRLQGETEPQWRARLGAKWAEILVWRQDHDWSPNQLRHTAATRLRGEFGIDLAQTILGHQLGSGVTEVYAEANVVRAMEIISRVG